MKPTTGGRKMKNVLTIWMRWMPTFADWRQGWLSWKTSSRTLATMMTGIMGSMLVMVDLGVKDWGGHHKVARRNM